MKYISDEIKNKVTISDLKAVKSDLIESTDLKTNTLESHLKKYSLKSDLHALRTIHQGYCSEIEFKFQKMLAKIDEAVKTSSDSLSQWFNN
jgi:hypothetical protein